MTLNEPEYYNMNGLSPLEAFEKGLISREECIGFIKGNIIKYVVRCDKKEDVIGDLQKAYDYVYELFCVFGAEELGVSISYFKDALELIRECDLKD